VGALTAEAEGYLLRHLYLGLVELIKNFLLWYESDIYRHARPLCSRVDNKTIYYVMFIILAALLLTAYLMRRSRYGLALRSIGEQ